MPAESKKSDLFKKFGEAADLYREAYDESSELEPNNPMGDISVYDALNAFEEGARAFEAGMKYGFPGTSMKSWFRERGYAAARAMAEQEAAS